MSLNGELIRIANRSRLNATEVSSLVEFSGQMLAFRSPSAEDTDSDTMVATAMFETWKESFDVQP